ncbi:MAG: ferrous iron transporter B [candidate division WOR-3 bacterium]
MKKILLFGNPNVGKSVIFSRLTGVKVIISNYPGTTVEYLRGKIRLNGEYIEVIDTPGTYSLDPSSPAEEVAKKILEESSPKDTLILNVVDSTNLERNLYLTIQLLSTEFPVIVLLNFWDEVHHKGITIDIKKLSELLDVQVIPTVAVTGFGIKELREKIKTAKPSKFNVKSEDIWNLIGEITKKTQAITHHHHTFLQVLEGLSIHPIGGLALGILILLFSFAVVRLIGESLINFVFEPIFENLWAPLLLKISKALGSYSFLHRIFIGELINGKIDFSQSFGLLSTGLYISIANVFPYIFSFYLILCILEDTGYLPRLAVLLDHFMHQIGIHGLGVIPMFLACGCNVPGVLATRIMETRKERFIAITLMSISIPCMAQTAMIFGLLGKYGIGGISPVFLSLFLVWVIVGKLMARFVRGESPEIFIEIPPYRVPHLNTLLEKLWLRISSFSKEALPFVLIGVVIVNLFHNFGVMNFLSRVFSPILTKFLGLPSEAILALFIGFLRKDLAVGMLAPLGLSKGQLITASTILTMYFPCVATFVVLLKELGPLDTLKATIIMLFSAFFVGWILNLIY